MPVMQFFVSELHTKNYRFHPYAFLKFRKISKITSAVEILFDRSRRSKIHFAKYLLKAVLWETSTKVCKGI